MAVETPKERGGSAAAGKTPIAAVLCALSAFWIATVSSEAQTEDVRYRGDGGTRTQGGRRDDGSPRNDARSHAEVASAPLVYYSKPSFRIKFNADPREMTHLREVQLWASTDQGETWGEGPVDRAGGDRNYFIFKAPRDGEYWFSVRSVDDEGRIFPGKNEYVEPRMKVVVDTTPPSLLLEPRGRRGSMATVRWEARDEHLKLKTLMIEYHVEGVREWRRVPVRRPTPIGEATWDAGTAEPIRARASVADEAGNVQEVEIALPDGAATDTAPVQPTGESTEADPPPPIRPADSAPASTDRDRAEHSAQRAKPQRERRRVESESEDSSKIDDSEYQQNSQVKAHNDDRASRGAPNLRVSSPRFDLKYDVDDAGPNGPAVVELWVTRDGGRSWSRLDEDPDHVSPYDVNLGGEGTFGLTLVAQSANGLGDPPPAPGDRPQIWVEVDSTPPTVTLDPPRVVTDGQTSKVIITWKAEDQHLGPGSVLLAYKPDQPEAKWRLITRERIDNTGRYVWNVPAKAPDRFQIRIDVYDMMDNRGTDDTSRIGAVVLDRARPRGRIIGLDPAGRDRPRR